MDDSISRRVAIDAVKELTKWYYETFHETRPTADAVIDKLMMLPSAQPEPSTEIQEILNYLDTTLHPIVSPDNWYVYSELYDMVSALPSVQPEPCEDAVSRKAVYEAMVEKGQRSRRYRLGETWELNGTEIREALDTVPSVTPKRKTGKWIDQKGGGCCCSECGRYALDEVDGNFIHVAAKSNYCPNCGADMRQREENK